MPALTLDMRPSEEYVAPDTASTSIFTASPAGTPSQICESLSTTTLQYDGVFRLSPQAPFPAAKCVGAEVDEKVHLHLLPLQLRRGGHRAAGGRSLGAGQCQKAG